MRQATCAPGRRLVAMRLWSLHPRLLDTKGLVACWRETLMAQRVLDDRLAGYSAHPQLIRLRATKEPLATVGYYLDGLWVESQRRGYRFDRSKIRLPALGALAGSVPVNQGQVAFEREHLLRKLVVRDPALAEQLAECSATSVMLHPLFKLVPGSVEDWEKNPLAVRNQ